MKLRKEDITKQLDDALAYIQEKKSILNQIEENPTLIFTDLFDKSLSQPYYDIHMTALNWKRYEGEGYKYHEIQNYIAEILISYLRDQDSNIEVRLASNSYPSSFKIRYQNEDILSFNIYKRYFGDFRSGEFKNGLDKKLKPLHQSINDWRKRIEEYESYDKKPSLLYMNKSNPIKSIRDYIKYQKHKEEVHDNLKSKIYYWEKQIKLDEEEIERIKLNYEKYLETKDDIQNKYDFWKDKFLSWGFEEVERRSHKLY
ncbi:hypothetical protein [Halalkalibacter oceani]|uniref:hypothetical protein n=1 Tax=Halalkalibacter oceani TaxID=1653776 RepID=UPI003391A306